MIENIIKANDFLKGNYNKIDVGYTNEVYSFDKYIVKICINKKNEKSFKKEIDFYLKNTNNNYIPKFYNYDISKSIIPYYYEIIEKLEGVSLYNVWHTFDEVKREDIIKQLCTILKSFHNNKGHKYNWSNYLKKDIIKNLNKAIKKNFFKDKELKLIYKAINKFDFYLKSDDFYFIHNDVHLDNIIYYNDQIKIIDFERSIDAPLDFELDIFYRMGRFPWKYASIETEKYTDFNDYINIKNYIIKYYPELFNNKYINYRLNIYDMVYFMECCYKYPHLPNLKEMVINSATYILYKDKLKFNNIKSPKQLLDFMNINIKYGWLDKNKITHINSLKGFRENYVINDVDETLEYRLGTCIEQVELEKFWFDKHHIETKIYCHRSYENKDNFNSEVKMHCFLLFKNNNNWYHFEHSNIIQRGIHKCNSLNEGLKAITKGFKERGDIRLLSEIDYIPNHISFKEFNNFVNTFDNIDMEKL